MINHYEYYKHPLVRQRIAEYCGGYADNPDSFSAEYIVGFGEEMLRYSRKEFISARSSAFHKMLDRGLDIFRSMWDKRSSLCILDIEYFNIDYAGEIYYNPERAFRKMEPLVNVIKSIYKRYGIDYLCIMTGQGYHFSAAVSNSANISKMLEDIGYVSPSISGKYLATRGKKSRKVSLRYGKEFDGIGRLLEFLTHKILVEGNLVSPIPVVFSDIPVGNAKEIGREAISIDLTAFADPVFMRDIRCPFSTHQKHKIQKYKVGDFIADNIPVQISLPRAENITLSDLLFARRHYKRASEIADITDCHIPIVDNGFKKLIADYMDSDLKKFHNYYDSTEHDDWRIWYKTYDKVDTSNWPPCLSRIIEKPNPYALNPGNIQTLARFLMKNGWHPKHIGGLLRSKYERDYSWATDWTKYDASSRADFWARSFAGFISCGIDKYIDYNCVSHQEKSMCPKKFCGHYL